ncbi:Glyoxylase, beta-lactamase superfamily II [Marininema mesophilum]|uniref:Glyoxylase, beta-lactamase superfamily II n=1 Tax=Marininema mesophilum TaxID=1048340 RepID=A0A1H2ZGG1_9BACL|nr:MBL fold metallo-hydrolase [Marininema mesophilum]SDX16510.1 Glyoxylase, beta-lactamase superfamily II [Marininema mesophilum]
MINLGKLKILEVVMDSFGERSIIHPTVIEQDDYAILIDAGYPGQLSFFREEMEKAGVPLEMTSKIIITHQDIDHIGSLPAILNEIPGKVEVLAHSLEKPFIQGDRPLIKGQALLKGVEAWPKEKQQEMNQLKTLFENPPKSHVDQTISGGDELPYVGGLAVIDTPGHTPGHISLYHPPTKTLITGDALFVMDGKLVGPPPQLTIDMESAIASVKGLMEYDIERLICYHGGLYEDNVEQRAKSF